MESDFPALMKPRSQDSFADVPRRVLSSVQGKPLRLIPSSRNDETFVIAFGNAMGMTKLPTTPGSEFLGKVTVRLMLPEERERFDQLLEEKHYLQSARLGGQSLR